VLTEAWLDIIKKVILSIHAFRRDEPRIKPIAPMQKVKLVIAAIILFHTGLHAQVSQETIAGLRAAYMQDRNDSAKMYLAGHRQNCYP
jgi:hypothetical protein